MVFCGGRIAIPSLLCLSSSWGATPCWRFFSLVSIQFWVRVDPETVSVSAASEKVAGVNRPVCNLTTSPLLTLCVSVPQSQCSWDGGSSPTMRWVAGICFSSLCADSCGSLKLRSSSGVLLTIIAPYWLRRPWVLEFLELVVDEPMALILDRDLLCQPHVHRQHLVLSRLALYAWRLSSDYKITWFLQACG